MSVWERRDSVCERVCVRVGEIVCRREIVREESVCVGDSVCERGVWEREIVCRRDSVGECVCVGER